MMNVRQAAASLGVSVSTVYQLSARRAVGQYRVGGKILFEPADLEAFKAGCHVTAAVGPPPHGRAGPGAVAASVPLGTLRHVTLGRPQDAAGRTRVAAPRGGGGPP